MSLVISLACVPCLVGLQCLQAMREEGAGLIGVSRAEYLDKASLRVTLTMWPSDADPPNVTPKSALGGRSVVVTSGSTCPPSSGLFLALVAFTIFTPV